VRRRATEMRGMHACCRFDFRLVVRDSFSASRRFSSLRALLALAGPITFAWVREEHRRQWKANRASPQQSRNLSIDKNVVKRDMSSFLWDLMMPRTSTSPIPRCKQNLLMILTAQVRRESFGTMLFYVKTAYINFESSQSSKQ
jgi:hypothetical protein